MTIPRDVGKLESTWVSVLPSGPIGVSVQMLGALGTHHHAIILELGTHGFPP